MKQGGVCVCVFVATRHKESERAGWVVVQLSCLVRMECYRLVVINTLPSDHFEWVMGELSEHYLSLSHTHTHTHTHTRSHMHASRNTNIQRDT